jgi:predicted MFS family arabinose efflux permease
MLFGNVGGAAVAIAAAWLLLPLWLDTGDGQFHFIFVISAICFSVAAVIGWQLAEGRDATRGESKKMKVTSSWEILRGDRSFRRASFLAFLFGTSFVLFPHYQALARVRLQIDFSDLVFWVIVQNAGTAVVSLVAGFIADARGNRIVLRFLLFGLFLLPTFSLFLSHDLHWGRSIFWGVFLLLGLVPVTLRTLQNYTLELAPGGDYPRYLSTLGLCIAAPMMVSPLVGLAIDRWGFDGVFSVVSVFLLAGWLQTFLLAEPRRAPIDKPMPGRLNVES